MSILLSLLGSNVPTAPSGSLMSKITIDTCGRSGHQGPTDAQITAAAVANVTASGYQGYQVFTAPNTGTYRFELAGGMGGVNTGFPYTTAGFNSGYYVSRGGYYRLSGAYVKGDVSLNANDTCIILVGQCGQDSSSAYANPGGGGGTFVTKGAMSDIFNSTDVLLFAAGGAGGSSAAGNYTNDNYINGSGQNASNPASSASGAAATTASGSANSGSSNAGGGGSYILSSATNTSTWWIPTANQGTSYNPVAAASFRNGGLGSRPTNSNFMGGFGGGGHGSSTANDNDKGGGGGYLGGGYAFDAYVCGGGGNSYIISSATNILSTTGGGSAFTTDQHGIVTIEQIS
jgi:hypothetical protein